MYILPLGLYVTLFKDDIMHKLSVSLLGRDCPGVVAVVSTLFEKAHCDVMQVSQTILSGEFAAIFIVTAPNELAPQQLATLLEEALKNASMDFSVIVRTAVEGYWGSDKVCQPFVVTAHGPNRSGLIAPLSRIFARHNVNIESLKAILNEEDLDQALFVYEIMVPEMLDLGRLRRELTAEGQQLSLRVSVQHRDIFEAVHRVLPV